MLIAIIDDKQKNILTYLYLDETSKRFIGYSIENGKIKDLDRGVIRILNKCQLGKHRKDYGSFNGHEVIVDLDSGLKHFFKGGRENFELFFDQNGINISMFNFFGKLDEAPKAIKKFNLGMTSICASLIILNFNLLMFFMNSVNIEFLGETVNLQDGASYFLDFTDCDRFDTITLEAVRDYIYSSPNIKNAAVKDFLYNEELFEDVLPYYKDTGLELISRIRCKDLGVSDYSMLDDISIDGTAGYYAFGNTLYIKGYNEEKFENDSIEARKLGHEEVHLLQSYTSFPLIKEACAEIISREYHMHSAKWNEDSCSYKSAVKYTQVLMEIIGSEPVWENNFKQNSTLLEDSIKSFLDESELEEFLYILNLHPYYNMEELNEKLAKLEELLLVLHERKYGFSMYSSPVIVAILNEYKFNRAYFSKSLIENEKSYYELPEVLSLKDASDLGLVKFLYNGSITYEEYMDPNYFPLDIKSAGIRLICSPHDVLENHLSLSDSKDSLTGYLIMSDGTRFSAEEAVNLRLAAIFYSLYREDISYEEYMANRESWDYQLVSTLDYLGFKLDSNRENILIDMNEPHEVELAPFSMSKSASLKNTDGKTLVLQEIEQ